MISNYDKLKGLLEAETYPHTYIHKFIGVKTADFDIHVEALEKKFPKAKKVSERLSAASGAVSYVALTYELQAENADEIIALLQTTALLPDLRVIL